MKYQDYPLWKWPDFAAISEDMGQTHAVPGLDPRSLARYLPWAAWRCSGRRDPPKLGPGILRKTGKNWI